MKSLFSKEQNFMRARYLKDMQYAIYYFLVDVPLLPSAYGFILFLFSLVI